MARYTGAVCRQCRREGMKLFLKGERCFSPKCSITVRPTPPGQHGQARQRKVSEYGLQLREKQKTRRIYGMMEVQFRRCFQKATKMKGVTGENMLSLLERRLDNVVYRLGIGASRAQARQFVRHGHINVNGKRVNIPSFLVDAGMTISVRDSLRDIEQIKALREGSARPMPEWLTLDAANLSATVDKLPERKDIDLSLEEHLIVELYSK